MNNSIVTAKTEGSCFDLDSLAERLSTLEDRRKAKGKRHSLGLVLTVVMLAYPVCGFQ